jgi:protein-S-isoprenylcysteine O-methyltransferase Ste14
MIDTDTTNIKVRPPFIVLGSIFLAIAVNRLIPVEIPIARGASIAAGVLLLLASVLLVAWSLRVFIREGQNPDPLAPTESLYRGGPYAWSRNPMYVAMFVFQTGLGFALNDAWVSMAVIGTFLAIHFAVVVKEETYLRKLFGQSYEDYSHSVRRYV